MTVNAAGEITAEVERRTSYARRPAADFLRHLVRGPVPALRTTQHARAGTRSAAVVTVTAGVGNAMGWYGAQGERYFGPDRLSAFVGAGYTISLDQYEPSGPTFAAGLRGYTAGFNHRGFLEASVSQIFTEANALEEGRRLYGPGLSAGYQYATRGGFTLMTSLGLGYAPGVDDGYTKVSPLVNLGFGYTWRRRPR